MVSEDYNLGEHQLPITGHA